MRIACGIRLAGGLPVIGALGGKDIGYVFSLFPSVVKCGLLLWVQIGSWVKRAGYSVYLAVKEWAKVVGTLSSAISGLTQGAAGYAAGVALFFTQTGCVMPIVRVGLEATGHREVLRQVWISLMDWKRGRQPLHA